MTRFNTNYLEALPFSDQTVQVALAASTALTYTIPGTTADLYRCEFSYAYDANVWVGFNTTAVVPVAGTVTTTSNTSIVLRPKIKFVRGGDVLSFISGSVVSNMGFELLVLPNPK
jgi:hypothetical protein